jgi:hypothetical protein
MHHIFTKISSPFVYGPLTKEEVDAVVVAKVQIPEPDGWYIGTSEEQAHLSSKKLFKWVPPVMEDAPPAE